MWSDDGNGPSDGRTDWRTTMSLSDKADDLTGTARSAADASVVDFILGRGVFSWRLWPQLITTAGGRGEQRMYVCVLLNNKGDR